MPPDRCGFVVELWMDELHFGEVFLDEKSLLVEIYPRIDGKPWKINALEVSSAIEEAGRRLKET